MESQTVQAVRQVRADYMVEVKVGGKWYLACNLDLLRTHTLGGPVRVGDSVRVPAGVTG